MTPSPAVHGAAVSTDSARIMVSAASAETLTRYLDVKALLTAARSLGRASAVNGSRP